MQHHLERDRTLLLAISFLSLYLNWHVCLCPFEKTPPFVICCCLRIKDIIASSCNSRFFHLQRTHPTAWKNLKFQWIFVIHCWKKCRICRINQWEVSPFIIVSSHTRPHFHFTMARGLLNTFWDPLIEIYDCNIFLLYILRHLDVLTAVYWHNIPLAGSNCCRTRS